MQGRPDYLLIGSLMIPHCNTSQPRPKDRVKMILTRRLDIFVAAYAQIARKWSYASTDMLPKFFIRVLAFGGHVISTRTNV